jgi:seryl-tRNA synthetase
MAAVFDSAEMNHRVAASESKLRAVAQDEREHNAQLLGVLESVEKTLEQNQQHIRRLEEKRDRTLEEFQQLRDLLHVMQFGRSRLLRRYLFPKSYAARADLIDRLDVIISTMNPVAEDGADGDDAKEHDTARARKPTRRGLAFLNFMSSLAAVALVAVFGFIGSLIAEALVARKANSSMPLYLVRRNKTMRREAGAHGRNI